MNNRNYYLLILLYYFLFEPHESEAFLVGVKGLEPPTSWSQTQYIAL